jgi:DNA-binding response OmpR family regulator
VIEMMRNVGKIIVVDDDPDVLHTTEVLPKKEGYDVTSLLCAIFLVITTLPATLPFLLIMRAMITIL